MKKRIISKLDNDTITLTDVEIHAYVGVENNTPGNPFKRGFLAQVEDNRFKMFFSGNFVAHIFKDRDIKDILRDKRVF